MEYDSVSKIQEELGYYKKYCQQLENQNAALNQQLFNNIQGKVLTAHDGNQSNKKQNENNSNSHKECEQRSKLMEKQLKQKLMEEQLWLKRYETQLNQIVELKATHAQYIQESELEDNQKTKEIEIMKEEIEHYKKQIEIYKQETNSQIYLEEIKEMRRQLEASEIKLEQMTKELQIKDQQLYQKQGNIKQSLLQFKQKFDIELKNENLSTEPDISSNSFSNIMLRDI
ncbi:unnamed protein product (macronuclear) [Paramecium tetraurelia]|uniref:Uncharacterized protein n=1 Tax=Paramecium tetraurelia TaxID=5888 RepID=A0D068_PARTE|nr:uncharacterized protein GSPATT00011987001 [Paramecium tetraurelia]CAK76435.1 unnamed protein product [Paramecium tetraurelia]|eukprot:XP_001443832.1 hypothetical protein (macronuclear) [Paramecium tetraurelia strain d4-2]